MKPIPGRYDHYSNIFRGMTMPLAFCDLDNLDRNIDTVKKMVDGTGKTVRVHSKSIRCPELLAYILRRGGDSFKGIMTFSARETLFLARKGFDDFIIAYPTVQDEDLEAFCETRARGKKVRLMVDSPEHLEILESRGKARGITLEACLEFDCSWQPIKSLYLGLRRSPIRRPEDAEALIRKLDNLSHVTISAVMGYEAHISGPNDAIPGKGASNALLRFLKSRSIREFHPRRAHFIRRMKERGLPIETVNGGGSGSLPSTLADPSITEATVGSGFYAPALFRHYRNIDFVPSVFFALQVVRIPGPGFVTCQGGGYPASGPAGKDKLPVPVYPEGLRFVGLEGAGEVQTPLETRRATLIPGLGDPVFFQHAKAGEINERFNLLHLLRGTVLEGEALTYRGEGYHFI